MPSSATITTFYTFTANTKARASQVNANFDIFRGHILPVSPNTQTAINNTYDLGSSEYRWRTLYLPTSAGTITASAGDWAMRDLAASVDFNTTGTFNVTGSTITLTTIGRPVMVGLLPAGGQASVNVGVTVSSAISVEICMLRDNVTIASLLVEGDAANTGRRYWTPSNFTMGDYPNAGTYNYHFQARISSGVARDALLTRIRFYAKEF